MVSWISLINTVTTAIILALVWGFKRAYDAGGNNAKLDERVGAIEDTLKDAGQKMSNLATFTQGLPERIRRDFAHDFVLREVLESRWRMEDERWRLSDERWRHMSDDNSTLHRRLDRVEDRGSDQIKVVGGK